MTTTEAVQIYHQALDAKAAILEAFRRGEASPDTLRVADRRASRAKLRYLEFLARNGEN